MFIVLCCIASFYCGVMAQASPRVGRKQAWVLAEVAIVIVAAVVQFRLLYLRE